MHRFTCIFILNFVLQLPCFFAQTLGLFDACTSENDLCLKIKSCPQLHKAIKNGYRPRICSFIGNEPVICCISYPSAKPTTESSDSEQPESSWTNTQPSYSRSTYSNPSYSDQPNNPPIDEGNSISARMCQEYTRELCPNSIPFVLGGEPARPRELPFMALIGYGSERGGISWKCGGSLISPLYVLSAAHCTRLGALPRFVRLGELDYSTFLDDAKPQQFRIVKIHKHPRYIETRVYNDILLYRLDREAVLSEYVRPICINQSPNLENIKTAIGAGWGDTSYHGSSSAQLLRVNLDLFSADECVQKYVKYSQGSLNSGINGSSMICAGSRDGERDTCQGDSGGPLFLEPTQDQLNSNCFLYTQIGITSFGFQCGLKDFPAVYSNVNYFLPWIESIVWPS